MRKLYYFLIFAFAFFSCKTEDKVSLHTASGALYATLQITDIYKDSIAKKIDCNSASSGILARQINSGADADIFISANSEWINFLIKNNKIKKESVTQLALNSLVIISRKDKEPPVIKFDPEFDITNAIKNRIVIGNPEYVPAGRYTKAFLDKLNWYNSIIDKAILATNVSATLHYVEMGEADWGVVYKSEALQSNLVRIDYQIPEQYYPEVIFYLCRLKTDNDDADKLFNFFMSDISRDIFIKNGFNTINE